MIRSMTGYGKAESRIEGTIITVEVSSVNSRFLDLGVRLPRGYTDLEHEVRKLVQGAVERGRVTVNASVDRAVSRAEGVRFDDVLAGRYQAMAERLAGRFGVPLTLDAMTLLTLPGVVSTNDQTPEAVEDTATRWEALRGVVSEALAAHAAMRTVEGAAIGEDVSRRLGVVKECFRRIEERAPEASAAAAARQREKIAKLLAPERFDEQRFAMEVAIYADRVDVTEECVRFRAHCEAFAAELAAPKASGKKLSFLLQELNREANTTASKANDVAISQIVVTIKEEMEKMREQVENME